MRAPRLSRARSLVTPALAAAALALSSASASGDDDDSGPSTPTCPQTSTATTWSGSVLDTDTTKSGVVYDPAGARLQLQSAAGTFNSTSLGISDATVFAAAADFDGDGWEDFVGVGEATTFVRIYENHTYENPEPDWDVVTATRTPKFVTVRELQAATTSNGWRPTAAADFNGDGWPDVFRSSAPTGGDPDSAVLWLNAGANDGNGDPTFNSSYAAMASSSSAWAPSAWGNP